MQTEHISQADCLRAAAQLLDDDENYIVCQKISTRTGWRGLLGIYQAKHGFHMGVAFRSSEFKLVGLGTSWLEALENLRFGLAIEKHRQEMETQRAQGWGVLSSCKPAAGLQHE